MSWDDGHVGRERARRALLRRLAAVGALIVAASIWMSPGAQALSERGHTFATSFGSSGSAEGQFQSPAGVAVNESTGDVYVVDRSNNRIEQFGPEGKFLAAWGWGVKDGLKEYEICKAGEGCKAGIPGTGKGAEKFKLGKEQLLYPEAIAVDNSAASPSKGDVYVVAAVVPEKSYVYKFGPEGEPKTSFKGKRNRLTTEEETVEKGRALGVSVDTKGQVFVAWSGNEVVSFTNAEPNKRVEESAILIEPESVPLRPGFAVDSKDNLLVNYEPHEKFEEAVEGRASEEGKGEGGTEPCELSQCFVNKLTSVAVSEPEALAPGEALKRGIDAGRITGIAADLASNNIYADEAKSVAAFTPAGELIQRFEPPGGLTKGSGVATNSATGTVYVADAGANKVDVFPLEPPGKPTISELSTTKLTTTTATLNALVDPTGAQTTVMFEYGTSPCASAECAKAPVPGNIGEGFGDQKVSAHVVGLTPGATYHYRMTATNEHGTVTSEEASFTTQLEEGGFTLPDNRAWEMVSRPEKLGAGLESITREGGLIQAAADGNAITYLGTGPDERNPEGNRSPTFTQFLAKRETSGGVPAWSSKDVTLPQEHPGGVEPGHEQEFELFSTDLSLSLVQPFGLTPNSEPPLSPEATEKTIYLRQSNGCQPAPSTCYTPVVNSANDTAGTQFGGVPGPDHGIRFKAATPDLGHVVFASEVALTPEPVSAGPNLYEWTAGKPAAEQLQLVNVLPNSTPAHEAGIGDPKSFIVRHAISDDGSRLVFTAGGHIYSRNMVTKQTVQVDKPEGQPEVVGTPLFQLASKDGTRIFFTDTRALTPEAKGSAEAEHPDLYAYDVNAAKLTDLTVTKSEESSSVRGLVIGASEDATTVYYVANGVLASGAKPGECTNNNGEEFIPGGTCNLYVQRYNTESQSWEAPKLIAILSNLDLPVWRNNNENVEYLTSRVSPNGRFLAFMSELPLTGYDNRDTNSGARDEEVFRYDNNAETKPVICVSCNPTGARPTGVFDVVLARGEASGEGLGLTVDRIAAWEGHWLAASLPGWTGAEGENAMYQSRYLSNTGRVYFNSADSLVPADVNGKEDVYQYESNGEGTCASENGCVSMLSSGKSSRESAFLDASESGNDVFFLTAAPLVSSDKDTNFDVYDARVCSAGSPCVVTSTSEKTPCLSSDACKGPAATAPAFATPATVNPSGSGNLEPGSGAVLHSTTKLTTAQRLARALKACKKQKSKKARVACERRAHKAFGAKKAKRAKKAAHRARSVNARPRK